LFYDLYIILYREEIINFIRNITRCWIETQKRNPAFQISSFTSSGKKEEEKIRPS
jgi:hypothetical protein